MSIRSAKRVSGLGAVSLALLFLCLCSSSSPNAPSNANTGTSSSGGSSSDSSSGGSSPAGSSSGGMSSGGTSSGGGGSSSGGLATMDASVGPGQDGINPPPPLDAGSTRVVGTTVTVDASGAYSVTFKSPAWTFGGNLGAPATGIAMKTGSDKLGSYSETSFTYSASGT